MKNYKEKNIKNYKIWEKNEIYFLLKYNHIIKQEDLDKLFNVSENSVYLTIKRYKKFFKLINKKCSCEV